MIFFKSLALIKPSVGDLALHRFGLDTNSDSVGDLALGLDSILSETESTSYGSDRLVRFFPI